MKPQPSKWLQMADALKTLSLGYQKLDVAERAGAFSIPDITSIPSLNGSNGHAKAGVKALPAPQKVKLKGPKALPPAPAEAAAAVVAKPAKVKAAAKPVKAKAAAKVKPAKAAKKAIVKAAKAAKPKAAPKAKGAAANSISAGRRAVANGDRPKLVDAIAIVMGEETLSAGPILERLVARGWQPGASNPQSYISFTLTSNPDSFKRGKRGEYSVKSPKKFEEVAAKFKSGKAAAAPKAAKAAKAPKAAKAKVAGSKKSGKAEGVASTDAGAIEATQQEPETATAEAAETAPVAGDPPTSTPDATATAATSATTDQALEDLGMGTAVVGENPFDALN